MADYGVSCKMFTGPFNKWTAEREALMRRAAMWTVREGARVVKRTARAQAPVLTGALRASIRPGRMRRDGVNWTLKVGPRGQRIHLYAGKEEERAGYMAAGYGAAEAMMTAAADSAYSRAWKGI